MKIHTGFVRWFVVTRDDGHDFYPYGDYDSWPTREQAREHVEAFIEFHMLERCNSYASAQERATAHSIERRMNKRGSYRDTAINEAVEYIVTRAGNPNDEGESQ